VNRTPADIPVGDDSSSAKPATRSSGLFWTFALSGIVALICLLVLIGQDPWKVLAVTRALDLLIEGGIIQYHDRQPGFIAGLPLPNYYYLSQEVIDWRLVAIAFLLMMLYPVIKAVQFDRIARACGSNASFGQHFSAFVYGDGLDRFLPFNMGMVGTARAMVAHGLAQNRAAAAVMLSRAFTIFEICAFALLGLLLLGWETWLGHMFWPVVVCAVACYLLSMSGQSWVMPRLADVSHILRGPMFRPAGERARFLLFAAALSLLAFGTFDVAVWVLMTAFDTTAIAISVDPSVLLMAVVGGYLAARIVTVTPGGIGQWEIGFATTLLLADTDISIPLLCIGLLVGIVRIASGITLMVIVSRGGREGTRLGEVFAAFENGMPSVSPRSPNGLDRPEQPVVWTDSNGTRASVHNAIVD
jgi:hypothetical protein